MVTARRSMTDGDAPTAEAETETETVKKTPVRKTIVRKKLVKKQVVKKKVLKTPTATTAATRKKPPTKKIAKVIMPSSAEWFDPRDPRPKRLSAAERLDLPPPASGAELVERVSWAIERELNQIELIVGGGRVKPTQRTEAERRARTLASLARTLSEVARLRAQHQQRPDDDDDAMPRDLDEFRETLALRLERLLAEESQPPDGDVQHE